MNSLHQSSHSFRHDLQYSCFQKEHHDIQLNTNITLTVYSCLARSDEYNTMQSLFQALALSCQETTAVKVLQCREMSTCNIFLVLVPCQNRPHIDYILIFLRGLSIATYRNPFTHKKNIINVK